MQPITPQQFNLLCQNAKVLTQTKGQPKVLETPDGEIIKIFYRRNGWSSSHIWPHAQRFVRNAAQLARLGVSSHTIGAIFYYPTKLCHIVTYPKLAGEELRVYLTTHPDNNLLAKFAHFLAHLHQQGVFFRGIHLGNVLYDKSTDRFSLIDIADLTVYNRSLSFHHRARNLAHLLANKEDRQFFTPNQLEQFLQDYWASAHLAHWKKNMILAYMTRGHYLKF